jgi:flagellar hook-length control protein FliK
MGRPTSSPRTRDLERTHEPFEKRLAGARREKKAERERSRSETTRDARSDGPRHADERSAVRDRSERSRETTASGDDGEQKRVDAQADDASTSQTTADGVEQAANVEPRATTTHDDEADPSRRASNTSTEPELQVAPQIAAPLPRAEAIALELDGEGLPSETTANAPSPRAVSNDANDAAADESAAGDAPATFQDALDAESSIVEGRDAFGANDAEGTQAAEVERDGDSEAKPREVGDARAGERNAQPHEIVARKHEHTQAAEKPNATNAPREAVLSNQRAADVLRQVRMQIAPDMRHATLQLEPAELGRISIRIAMRGGEVHAEVRAEKRSTLDALERHAPELRAALERAGLATGQLALQLGLDDSRSQQGSQHESGGAGNARTSFESGTAAPRALQRALSRSLDNEHGVDTYA